MKLPGGRLRQVRKVGDLIRQGKVERGEAA